MELVCSAFWVVNKWESPLARVQLPKPSDSLLAQRISYPRDRARSTSRVALAHQRGTVIPRTTVRRTTSIAVALCISRSRPPTRPVSGDRRVDWWRTSRKWSPQLFDSFYFTVSPVSASRLHRYRIPPLDTEDQHVRPSAHPPCFPVCSANSSSSYHPCLARHTTSTWIEHKTASRGVDWVCQAPGRGFGGGRGRGRESQTAKTTSRCGPHR